MIPLKDDNPTGRAAVVSLALLVACVAAHGWQMSLPADAAERAVLSLGAVPALLTGHARLDPAIASVPAWATVLTSMFLHGGWLHLGGNMLYLWIFGDNVEDAFGHLRFALFYVACGVAAVAAQALPAPDSTTPMIGASGAISGVLGAYLLLFPRARVLVAIPLGLYLDLRRLPAVVVLVLWFALQLASTLLGDGNEGVAFRAHLGGFIAGLVLAPLFRRAGVPLLRDTRMERR